MPYGAPNDPDAPYHGQRVVVRTPAEEQAIADLARAHEAVQQYADAQGTSYRAAWDEAAGYPAPQSAAYPSSGSYAPSTAGYTGGSSGSSGGSYGGGYSFSGGGGGGGGVAGASTAEQAQRQLDFMKQLLGSDMFDAQHVGIDPGVRHDVRRAGRKDIKSANRQYNALDRYLANTRSNPYRGMKSARAPGREGKQSAAAFQSVLKILSGDTKEANKSKGLQSQMGRTDAIGEIKSGRDAFMSGLRMQAWQQQMQQQAMLNQAKIAMIMQMAQLFGSSSGEMPDIESLLGSLAPTPSSPPSPGGGGGGAAGGPGRGSLPIGGSGNRHPKNPPARNNKPKRRVGSGRVA